MPLQSWIRRSAVAVMASLALAGAAASARQKDAKPASVCELTTTERVVAIADVHGAYDKFVAMLREAGLIDAKQHWSGGRAVFVQTGDILDRGADSRKALDLLRRLETEAPKDGGRVIPLLGNHEVLRMLGDLKDTSAGEYAAFKSPDAADLQERYYQSVLASEKSRTQKLDEKAFRKEFLEKVPLGFVEMQLAFAADGEYGKWLRTHDTMAIVNGVVYLHGGPTQTVANLGCATINDNVRSELRKLKLGDEAIGKSLIAGEQGPLWYRGLVKDPPEVDAAGVDGILRALHARAIVVGHTVASGKIRQTFDGRVTQIDTGMLGAPFWPTGAASALEVAKGAFTAIYADGKRETLSSPSAGTRAARH